MIQVPNSEHIVKFTELNDLQQQTLSLFGITKKQFDMKV